MSQNDDHIGQEEEDSARTLDAVKPLYEIAAMMNEAQKDRVVGRRAEPAVPLAQGSTPVNRH